MKTVLGTFLFLALSIFSNGQEIEYFVKSNCFPDSLRIQLSSKENKKKNVEEIKIEKTFYALKTIILNVIEAENQKIIIENLENSKCYFMENFSKIENKKIREKFLQSWLEIKKATSDFAKKNDRKTEISLIHFLETTGVKEVDNLFLARKNALEYIKMHKAEEKSYAWENIRRVGDDKSQKGIEIGLFMLIEVYKIGLPMETGLGDFQYALKELLNCIPKNYEGQVYSKWKKIIGDEAKIYLQ